MIAGASTRDPPGDAVQEKCRGNTALVMVGDGVLVQSLPSTLKLKKFDGECYSTGMLSRFASHVEAIDPDDGSRFERVIEVNEPLRYKGVTVYQSNLDDGGSKVTLAGYPLRGSAGQTFSVQGTVGESNDLSAIVVGQHTDSLKLNITGLRPINVEDIGNGKPRASKQGFSVSEHVAAVTGSAAGRKNDHLRNLGLTVEYQQVDAAGQSHEFRATCCWWTSTVFLSSWPACTRIRRRTIPICAFSPMRMARPPNS